MRDTVSMDQSADNDARKPGACEPCWNEACWNEAYRQSRLLGGSQVDHYLRLLDRDGLRGVKRAVFIDRGGHAPGGVCPSAEPSPHDPHEYWCGAPVPGQADDGEPCACGAEGRVFPPGQP